MKYLHEESACFALFLQLNPSVPKIVGHLQIEPKLRGVLKNHGKFEGHRGGDSALVAANLIHHAWGTAKLFSKGCLAHFHWDQKLFQEHISRFCWVNVMGFFHKKSLMVVTNSNVLGARSYPTEHDTPLIIDPDGMKTLQIPCQDFKSISRWDSEIFQMQGKVKCIQFLFCNYVKTRIKSLPCCFRFQSVKDIFGSLIRKRSNHSDFSTIYHLTTQWYKKNKGSVFFFFYSILTAACASRAPTECELDKRSGLYPSSFCEDNGRAGPVEPLQGSKSKAIVPSEVPVRSEPLVKKVWIHDQILEGGHWMQGTWAFIEVEPSKWVGSGPAPGVSNPSAPKPSSILIPLNAPKAEASPSPLDGRGGNP